jgi:hypothetical protein
LKISSINPKNVCSSNKNKDQITSSKILINQLKEIQISKNYKTTQKKSLLTQDMKNRELLK